MIIRSLISIELIVCYDIHYNNKRLKDEKCLSLYGDEISLHLDVEFSFVKLDLLTTNII